MSSVLRLLGTGAAVLVGLAGLGFVWTFLRERAWRAAAVAASGTAALLAALLLPVVVPALGAPWLYGTLLAGIAVVVVAVCWPHARPRPLAVVGPVRPVDERDAVFHRFYRLQAGTADYATYYAAHPELQPRDDRLRAAPDLGAPGTPHYDPVTSQYAGAAFDLLSRIATGLDDSAPVRSPEGGGPPPALTPRALTDRLLGYARHLGAVDAGCAPLDPAFVYSHIGRGEGVWGAPVELPHRTALVVAVEMAHEMVAQAPAGPVLTESATRYVQSATIALLLARVLERLGYRARAHVDGNYRVLLVPLAVAAGLGELGRLGLLITPRHGPRVRLAAVTTDAPLVPGRSRPLGVAAFCALCEKCADACPSQSIPHGPAALDNGVVRWMVRRETCYRYWRSQGTDCGLCLKVCPYAHPDALAHRVVRGLIRRNPLARRLALWGDDLCYGRRPTGRPAPPPWHAPLDGAGAAAPDAESR